MDLLKRNNLAHHDDSSDGTRRVIVYFSMQVADAETAPEKQIEERFIAAMRQLYETIGNKLDCIVADYESTYGRYSPDNIESEQKESDDNR